MIYNNNNNKNKTIVIMLVCLAGFTENQDNTGIIAPKIDLKEVKYMYKYYMYMYMQNKLIGIKVTCWHVRMNVSREDKLHVLYVFAE